MSDRRALVLATARHVLGVGPLDLEGADAVAAAEIAAQLGVSATFAARRVADGSVTPAPDSLLEHLSTRCFDELGNVRDDAPALEPDLVVQVARRRAQRQVRQMMEVLEDLHALLHEADVPMLALKGAHATAAGWLPAGDRLMADLDVLVPEDRGSEAVETLLGRGFWSADGSDPRRATGHHHLPDLVDPTGIVHVELHTHAVTGRWRRVLPAEEIWSTSGEARSTGGNGSTQLMDDTQAVTLTILHALGTDAQWRARVLPLRTLVDLRGRASSPALGPIDWPGVVERFARVGAEVVPLSVVALARRLGVSLGADSSALPPAARRHARQVELLCGRPALTDRAQWWASRLAQLHGDDIRARYGTEIGLTRGRARFVRSWWVRHHA